MPSTLKFRWVRTIPAEAQSGAKSCIGHDWRQPPSASKACLLSGQVLQAPVALAGCDLLVRSLLWSLASQVEVRRLCKLRAGRAKVGANPPKVRSGLRRLPPSTRKSLARGFWLPVSVRAWSRSGQVPG